MHLKRSLVWTKAAPPVRSNPGPATETREHGVDKSIHYSDIVTIIKNNVHKNYIYIYMYIYNLIIVYPSLGLPNTVQPWSTSKRGIPRGVQRLRLHVLRHP